ncbi:MAG: biopolymer transporter ExbD [Acidobacteria bacterium RIFCSPLOWO2_02_FULL_61_28]|nr:MAG: biopolymer transporter ExbD [Acidobacteria bacterium RIFCSPLOWO2_02_FULL_61_28]
MGMAVGGRKGVKSEPNIVPLIDILLVLLIIFMVITPLVPKGLDALVPQPNPNKPEQEVPDDMRTVVVSVNQGGALLINQDPVTKDQLGARLTEIFKTRAERVMFVKGDPEILFGDVAEVIDIAKGAQIDKIGLITAKIEEGQ